MKRQNKKVKSQSRGDVTKNIGRSIIDDIYGSRLFKIVNESFSAWLNHWPLVLLCVFLEFIFLVGVSGFMTIIQILLFEHLEAVMRIAGELTGGLTNLYDETSQVTTGLSGLTNNTEFLYHLNIIFKYIAVMIAVTFVLWVIFQGIIWFISHKITAGKDHQHFFLFWRNFALQSIPFYLLSITFIFLSVRMLFSVKTSMAPILNETFLNFIFLLFIGITWYFGALSYTITTRNPYLNVRTALVYGVRKFPQVIQTVLFLVAVFFVIDRFLRLPFIKGDSFLLVILGIIILMPAFVFARIMLFKTTHEYPDDKQ
ncbi:MAG: hypothetical protein V1729_04295 [Candidatus Woesearchaeota archaeon]